MFICYRTKWGGFSNSNKWTTAALCWRMHPEQLTLPWLLLHYTQNQESDWLKPSKALNIWKQFSPQRIFKYNNSSGSFSVCSVYNKYDCYLVWDMSIELHQCFSVPFTHLRYFPLLVFVLSALQCSSYRSHLCLCPSTTLSSLWVVREKYIVVPSFPSSPQSKYLLTASETNTLLLLIFFYTPRGHRNRAYFNFNEFFTASHFST